jgi:hypothetical protein
MKKQWILIGVVSLALLLLLAVMPAVRPGVGLAQAQEKGPGDGTQPQDGNMVAAALADAIPIQGRLTDVSGAPLTGAHSVTFRLYDDPNAGTLLCSTNYNPLSMTNGLFNVIVTGCSDSEISGSQLYLGVQVDADSEMTPRQPIYAVPYARSLRPGADIRGELAGLSLLALYNSSTADSSKGLYSEALGASGITYAVYGRAHSPDGYGGYFDNTSVGGVGLLAKGGGSIAADIVLGGIASGGNDDDGRILSDPAFTSSDIYLISNDAILLDLDDDNDEDGDLEVRNSGKSTILKASENGNVHLGIDAGAATAITVGDRYRDNAVVAWAKILGGNPGSIQAEYGISSVDHYATGCYKIYLDITAANAATLIPIAVAELDAAPANASQIRIVSINQLLTNIFDVYINDGSGNLVNNDFVFMVTAR